MATGAGGQRWWHRPDLGLLLGGLAAVLLIGLNGLHRGSAGTPAGFPAARHGTGPQAEGSGPAWLGCDLAGALGPLPLLPGHPDTLPDLAPDLRLWIIVTDDECPACLEEIPAAAALLDSLALPGADAVAVALGDRFEARRTFWGLQAGIPLVWSSRRDLPASLGIERTPALLLDWCGRIVDASIEPVDRPSGRRRLLAMLRRWSGGWTDR